MCQYKINIITTAQYHITQNLIQIYLMYDYLYYKYYYFIIYIIYCKINIVYCTISSIHHSFMDQFNVIFLCDCLERSWKFWFKAKVEQNLLSKDNEDTWPLLCIYRCKEIIPANFVSSWNFIRKQKNKRLSKRLKRFLLLWRHWKQHNIFLIVRVRFLRYHNLYK